MSSYVLPYFPSLPTSPLSRSNSDNSVGGGGIMEGSNTDEPHLSFSSSSGVVSKSSYFDLPVDENEDENDSTAAHVMTMDSSQQLYSATSSSSSKSLSQLSASNWISASAGTTRMSNMSKSSDCASPPNWILGGGVTAAESNNKRSIFGKQTQKKYCVRRNIEADENSSQHNHRLSDNRFQESSLSDMVVKASIPIATDDESNEQSIEVEHKYSPLKAGVSQAVSRKTQLTPPRTPNNADDSSNLSIPPPITTVGYQNFLSPNMSPLTPAGKAPKLNIDGYHNFLFKISDAEESCSGDGTNTKEYAVQFDPSVRQYNNEPHSSTIPIEDDVKSPRISQDSHHHAQALLLSLAFFFIWSPQNLLAPNLTQAAHDFGYGDNTHARDLYLGSNLALASSVLSLPFSALIGFASDVVSSRRVLISVTTLVGGMAAIATGMSTTYPQLILSRFVGGSCMSGSVPVVFSLLSDWFDDKDRNAASSGFTAMMAGGMILGQVYAGCTGPTAGWRHSFYISGILTIILSILVMVCVREPIRGGKEEVLREMLARGRKYEKKLTWSQFVSSMTNHSSNCLLMLQGFFSNIPWGVMFVFLNDFLSQEKGLTVPDATFIVAVFGVGCAVGGILGGYLGSLASRVDRRYLPLFMALTTLLGVGPFLALLDDSSYDHASFMPCIYAFAGGCLASMPSVNVRPCIINVNPPEIRGAALTCANLIINAARGAGPSFFTTILMGVWGFNRALGLNIMIIAFWTITSIQLALLAKTLPLDQERMETELANYAMSSMDVGYGSISVDDDTRDGVESYCDDTNFDCDRSLYSIENQASSFDATAAMQSIQFVGDSLHEIGDDLRQVVTNRPVFARRRTVGGHGRRPQPSSQRSITE